MCIIVIERKKRSQHVIYKKIVFLFLKFKQSDKQEY